MIAAVVSAVLAAGLADPAPALGLWRSPEDGGALIRIETCGEAVCGRLVGSRRLTAHPDQADVRNHDPALRSRPLANLLILKATPVPSRHWAEGWVYDPADGGLYRGALDLAGKEHLRLTGCVVAVFCRSQTWTRVAGREAAEPAARPTDR